MKPRRAAVHKPRRAQKQDFLSERSALLVTMALLVASGAAGLLYAAHQPAALIALGAVSTFAAALRLFDDLIG